MKGKKHSAESKAKMSASRKGSIPWNKGMKGLWLNRHFDVLNSMQKGEKHPRWKEDRTTLRVNEKKHLDGQYRDWMKSVKDRDNWKCQIADENCKGRLEAHHILNWMDFPELRYEINNGITLCLAHHPRGRTKEKRLESYFQELVSVSSK